MAHATQKYMSESFAALFEESLKRSEMRTGEVITAEVVRIEHNHVVVNAGLFTHPKGASTANYSRTQGLEDESCMRAGDCMLMTSDGL